MSQARTAAFLTCPSMCVYMSCLLFSGLQDVSGVRLHNGDSVHRQAAHAVCCLSLVGVVCGDVTCGQVLYLSSNMR